jgi:hypothetical protein
MLGDRLYTQPSAADYRERSSRHRAVIVFCEA